MTSKGIVGEFLALKEETDADLLAMQCGDFYEFFAEDAELVGEELDLKVSQKSSHGSTYPMAGVPVNDLTPYLKALVERGYRVAVADQYETDDGHAREISRVTTPGTLLETSDVDARYLAAVVADGAGYGLAFADVTTGRFLATDTESASDAYAELYRFDPAEFLPGPDVRTDDEFLRRVRESTDASVSLPDTESFAPGRARHAVREQFGRDALDSVGLDSERAVRAAGAVLAYVRETGVGVAQSMTRLRAYGSDDHLELDATTQRNLELTETMHGDHEGSLLSAVDHTVTSPGRRLLREWLTRPRRSRAEIERRLDCVEALSTEALAREGVRDALGNAYDLERLASRTAGESANARDLLAVRDTLAILPELAELIERGRLADSPLSDVIGRPDREAAAALRSELDDALREDPPDAISTGGLFRRGYDGDLDDLIERHESAREWLDTLDERVKRQYGLSHVTVDRNKTDGYYVQVGKSVADEVPEHFREIKTLKNSKRFVTGELEEREREVLRLEEARGDLERELFCELRGHVAERAELLQTAGRALAEVDALASLATHAAGNDWTRPELTEAGPLRIEAGRHPVVERTTEFVPNDLRMDEDRRFLIVTGPNMSGKSTYMRQAALITLLAHVGSFVPARAATVGQVDGIYTRVGALDELAQGRSTFMVEMQELSNILHSATEESLVILDEVGRGTATYDGISIAWAATEYLHHGGVVGPDSTAGGPTGPSVLFATHYHELTTLADTLDEVENVHMAADEQGGDVTFLRTIRDGPADRSYGIHVAELAGVPDPVVNRAQDVLRKLREDKAIDVRGATTDNGTTRQVTFDLSSGQFKTGADGGPKANEATDSGLDPETEQVLDELESVDVNEMSPLELAQYVQDWQRNLSDR